MTFPAPEPSPNAVSNAAPQAAATADTRQDPAMRNLYKMSRTAGVGLGDYAAVNVFAVVGIILALASVLVLIFADATALLLIPLGAIVLSLIALFQIQHSNGTQTGRVLAILGVVIALGLGGTNVFGRVAQAARDREDKAQLAALVKQFHELTTGGKTRDAYELFDSRFREKVQPETFERTIGQHMGFVGGARVTDLKVGERVVFETDANGVRFATALLMLHIEPPASAPAGTKPLDVEEPAEFHKVDDQWKFRIITNWFGGAAQGSGQGR